MVSQVFTLSIHYQFHTINSTCYLPPPGIPPGICNFFLTWQSPHPLDSSSTTDTLFCVQNIDGDIDFRTVAEPDVLART